MQYEIKVQREFLRAELYDRQTLEETREFFKRVASSAEQHLCRRVLIYVHSSKAVFTIDRTDFFAHFKPLSRDPSHKVALLGDTEELGVSHEYVEMLGRQRQINVRNFRDEAAALRWLRADH